MKLRIPFNGTYRLTQRFGENPQNYPLTKGHSGVDWGIPVGVPILASAPGKVIRAGWDQVDVKKGYGKHVRIDHNGWTTIYGHLSRVDVEVGQQVKAGQPLGLSGNTGMSTGPHLHWELRKGSTPVDPLPYLSASPEPAPDPETKPAKRVALVQVSNLRVRNQPGLFGSIMGQLPAGVYVYVLATSGEGNNVWAQIGDNHWSAMTFGGERYMEWM